ncbi:YeeE/YedE family protein [Leucothrix pacifica]|uniref:Uncharacterized protein n=1 Tax=Leucothrix pacifica TaxID=1247513 RepID=A0A317CPM1_9GAMM|nr:YeeE/YedE family protein [Leucothrix pacifica]PWR00509.1 hypothetical protein DKW60_01425 [Leucothrix pacifica]
MEITTQVLLWAFGLAFILGVVATKTNFCTMGAVSDVVNIGDTGRMRAWVFAMGAAILGVLVTGALGYVDISMTADNDVSNPPYRTAMFAWPRNVVGGLIFGIGMTLGSGCGNKTLLRVGGGNIKSVFVLLVMGLAAYMMIFTNVSYDYFIRWMEPAFIDLTNYDIEDQSLGSIVSGIGGFDADTTGLLIGAVLGVMLIQWALSSKDFTRSFDNVLAGVVVAAVIVAAWWVTTGEVGVELLDEVDMMDERPYAVGAQSFTFVQPSGHLLRWIETGFSNQMVTFALCAAFGVVAGGFLYSLVAGKFRIEWFSSWKDFFAHIIGGFLMGIGGVLAMGCTIGQAVTGVSTLALGSFLTFAAIVFGSALTMKIQYYGMVYEDESNFFKALSASLADMHLLPNSMRQLEKV